MGILQKMGQNILRSKRVLYDKSVEKNVPGRIAKELHSPDEIEATFLITYTPGTDIHERSGLLIFCGDRIFVLLWSGIILATTMKKVRRAKWEGIEAEFKNHFKESFTAEDALNPTGCCSLALQFEKRGKMPGDTRLWFFGRKQKDDLVEVFRTHGKELTIPQLPVAD